MPDWKQEIRRRLADLKREPAREAEIVEELSLHLEDHYAELLASGATSEEAYRAALVELSDSEMLQRELQRVERWAVPEPVVLGTDRRANMIADLWQDLRFGVRMLMKQPGFTLIAVVTLALGIGANTTIFTVLNVFLLKPIPGITEQERLVRIGMTTNGQGFNSVSLADYRDYRDQNSTFAGIAAEGEKQFHLGTDTTAERIKGALVTGNYFDVLGIRAAQGRLLQPSDAEVEGANPVAVISERLWRNQLGGTAHVVGRTISLNSHPYTIIGVAAEFKGTGPLNEKTDVWIPVTMWRHADPWMVKLGVDWFNSRASDFAHLFGRLKPGVTVEQGQADLSTIANRLAQSYPETNAKRGARVFPRLGMSPADAEELRQFFGIQFGIVGIVLLIACANIAGLMLARMSARRKEMGVRLALGAGRRRIVRQLLTESTLMALLGGAFALVVAAWLTEGFRAMLPDKNIDMREQLRFALDWRVMGFTLGLSVITGLLFGIAPALQSSKLNLLPLLKDSGGAFGRNSGTRLRNVLVIAQIALSLILLFSAGLCIRTLQNANAVDLGFATENLLTAKLDLGRQNYSEPRGRLFYQQLLERMGRLPEVQAASLALTVPLQGNSMGNTVTVNNKKQFNISYNIVTPGYLDTMGIPLLLGRRFSEQDNAASPRVAIINENFARNAWPGENPVGKSFQWKDPGGDQPVEVIGVARDAKDQSLLRNPPRIAYFPLAQKYDGGMTLHLRTATRPEQMLAAVQQEIRALDPRLPIYNVKTLEQYRRDALTDTRIQAVLVGGFGLLALMLASLGLYGVLSYSVAQRTQEIGIRMALGATESDVLRLVIGQGGRLVAIGIALGWAGALAATRVLKSFLYGVSATDPLTFIAVVMLLTFVALFACWIPARRATRVDPLVALRCE
jgi:macrolide transport system ATP-binding/permease protein